MKFDFRDYRVWIDFLNMILGLAIIIIAILAMQGENNAVTLLSAVFMLGAVMFLLNAIRNLKTNKVFTLIFLLLTAGMVIAGIYTAGGI